MNKRDMIIKCPQCKKEFSHNEIRGEWIKIRKKRKCQGRVCKCGNLWVGPTFIEDSRYPFYVTIKFKEKSAEIFEISKEKKNGRTA